MLLKKVTDEDPVLIGFLKIKCLEITVIWV